MFSSLVPLYNAFIWLVNRLSVDVLLDSLIKNVPSIKLFGLATAGLCKHMALEISPYITSMVIPCDYNLQGDLCYEPGNDKTIDLITAMADVRRYAPAFHS